MLRFSIKLNLKIVVSLFLLGSVTLAAAQRQTCPQIVQAALDATDEQCSGAGRNQACYGNVNLEAIPQAGVSEFNFRTPGDIEAVNAIGRLSLSSKVEPEGEWGVVLMRLQANLPDTLPGQNITFLLFGDVQLQNGVESRTDPVTFDVTAQGDVVVYRTPAADETPLSSLSDGDMVRAVGRNAERTWLQVSLTDNSTGWVLAEAVEAAGDIEALTIVGADGVPFRPMQAFYFQSGIGDAPCKEAPDSGILVQTPQGVEQVQFTVNDVNITMGSTVYFQAQAHGEMTVSVVEGEVTVEADGLPVDVPAGSQVSVPLDDQGHAFGVPSEPQPYDDAKMAVLPIRILPGAITVAALASAESVAATPESRETGSATLITIGSQPDWVDSGISLNAGQSFTIEAHGRMNPCLDTYPNGAVYCIFYAPQGSPFIVTQNNEYGVFPALGQRFMALMGRIGDGEPFTIGAGGTFTAAQAGTLWFTPNDNTRSDNRGTFSVWVWLEGDDSAGG